ncbi:hypothetical protein D3C72_2285650 [compost metagenome]
MRVSGLGKRRKAANAPSSWRIDITDTKPTPSPARTACFTPSTPASSRPTEGARPASAKARSTSLRTPEPGSRMTSADAARSRSVTAPLPASA